MENRLAEDLDTKRGMVEFYDEAWPLIKKAAKFKNIDDMLKNFAPLAVLTLVDQAMNAKSESVRQSAATELLHMSEGKPLQKQLNVTRNIDRTPETEIDSMIRGLMRAAQKGLPQPKLDEVIVIPPQTKIEEEL